MKAIIKTLLFVLAVVLLCQCEKDPEPEVTIPDNNFLNALIELGVDTNGDGIISTAEAEAITFLNVSHKSISDITGIEAFVNLDCSSNQLTTLDISNNTALLSLRIGGMPSLNQVCIWTLPFPPYGVYVYTDGSPNVYFTTDCN